MSLSYSRSIGNAAAGNTLATGIVNTYADLPPAADHLAEVYDVLMSTGIYLINRKVAGYYKSDGVNWNVWEVDVAALDELHAHEASSNAHGDSGVNTGDETQVSIKNKLGAASASNDGFLASGDWSAFTITASSNTGDETQSTIKSKLGLASASGDGYLASGDWGIFNAKQDALGFTPEDVSNKSADPFLGNDTPSVTLYPTQSAVKQYIDLNLWIESIK